jgi:hypothetical protein
MALAGPGLQIQMETRHGFLRMVSEVTDTRTQMETLGVKRPTVLVAHALLIPTETLLALLQMALVGRVSPTPTDR